MHSSSNIRGIAFDAFGTLIRSECTSTYQKLLLTAHVDDRRPFMVEGFNIAEQAAALGLPELIPSLLDELRDEIDQLRLFDDAAPVLAFSRASALRLAVCSNLAADYASAVRSLLPNMDAYVLSCEVGCVKPEPAIYQAVCRSLGFAPQEILFVGDSRRCDVDGPRHFGMLSAHLDRKAGDTVLHVVSTALEALGDPGSRVKRI